MSLSEYLPAVLMFASMVAVPAHAGSGASTGGISDWEDIPEEASGTIATGDFNRDGIADMVEATSPEGNGSGPHVLTVLLGRKDGTFATVASHHPIGSDPRALVVGDFNGDGKPDVIVGDGDGSLVEFLGDGKGNLANARTIATVGSVVSIASGHFTRSGRLDLVVSDFGSNSATILMGAGNGSFRFGWRFELPQKGARFHIATADFNKDGLADLVISSHEDDNYEVMLGNGNGTFTYAPELSHLRDPYSYCPS